MKRRRDILVGLTCLAGAGAAFSLTPRTRVTLLAQGDRVEDIVPRAFDDWTSQDVTDLVAPKIEGSLVTKLYNETVGRVYRRAQGRGEIMVLLAHGDTQTDDLQLHRPEICYPAFGFSISSSAVTDIGLGSGVSVPSRQLVADAPDRRETIIYWSRLGEFLPLDRRQQQVDRLKTAMMGDVSDGLLARFSVNGPDSDAAVAQMRTFIPALVLAVSPARRGVLIGSTRANALREAKA